MSGPLFDSASSRPRPVADAPVGALEGRAEELARRWAFALLAAHPLAEMTAVPLEEIARHGPALCASVARALASDEELALFADAGAPEQRGPASGVAALGALAASWGAAEAVEHLEALRHVLLEATLAALASPSPREVADLSDRLASVCSVLLVSALAEPTVSSPGEDIRRASRLAHEQVPYRAPGPSPGRLGAVLIDECDEQARPALAERPGPLPRTEPLAGSANAGAASGTAPRPLPWDIPLEGGAPAATAPPAEYRGDGEDAVLRVSRGPLTPGGGPPH